LSDSQASFALQPAEIDRVSPFRILVVTEQAVIYS
jgi:hypothetical protein